MQRVAIGSSLLGFGASATEAAASEDAIAGPASVEDPRVRVIATLGEGQHAAPRAVSAMRELITEHLDAADAEYLELAPRAAVLRVAIVDEADGTQGFYGVLRLEHGRDAIEGEISCSRCGGSGFLAALAAGVDTQARRLRDTLAASKAEAAAAPIAAPPSEVPTAARKRAKWPWSWWGWTGLCLSATGVASAAVGVGFFGYGATHPSDRAYSRDFGVIFLGIAAVAIVVGVPPLAVELHRMRKHRRRSAIAVLPTGWRHGGGISLRVGF